MTEFIYKFVWEGFVHAPKSIAHEIECDVRKTDCFKLCADGTSHFGFHDQRELIWRDLDAGERFVDPDAYLVKSQIDQ